MASEEPIVDISDVKPSGYAFVRSGNVYITKNCRTLTKQAGRTVFVVRDSRKRNCGIRVPEEILKSVLKLHAETKEQRKDIVKKRDSALKQKVKVEILMMFPRIPEERVEKILKHMLVKRSGRVGRSRDLPLRQMAELAVRAHVRHNDTDYDGLLREGTEREVARKLIKDQVDEVVKSWFAAVPKAMNSSKEPKKSKKTKNTISASMRRSSLRLKTFSKSNERMIDISWDPMDIDPLAAPPNPPKSVPSN